MEKKVKTEIISPPPPQHQTGTAKRKCEKLEHLTQ
jgi:hypothetical protein